MESSSASASFASLRPSPWRLFSNHVGGYSPPLLSLFRCCASDLFKSGEWRCVDGFAHLRAFSSGHRAYCAVFFIEYVLVSICFVALYLITHFSEFQLATVGTFLIHESVFFLSGLPSIYFERSGLFSKYKIQKKSNTSEAQEKCILRLIMYHVLVNLPVMLISYPTFRYMGLRSSLPLPHWTIIFSQIVLYFILEDFVFYWGHRILHTKWLYKHVHSIHHEYATPFGLTSEYAHPAEILFLGFATIVGPALTGPHLFTLWLWMVLRVLETVEVHSGYHFPWSPSNFLPLYGGADFHDYHHRVLYTKSGNYASTFVYMDWLFGTDNGYRKLKALEEVEGKNY